LKKPLFIPGWASGALRDAPSRAAAILFSALVSACSIHPIPDDVTGITTSDIVRNVRCEARDAIRGKIVAVLGQVEGDPAATRYSALLRKDRHLWLKFDDRWFSPEVRAALSKYEASGIAYNFSLNITEVNNIDPTIDIFSPLSRGAFTSSIGGGVDRTRQNARTFTITDTWLTLIKTVDDTYCEKLAHVNNYLYPITGRVGIDEMIDTFVDLAQFDNLGAPKGDSGKPPTLADDLTFTTKLSLGGTPKVVFTPLARGVGLADANLGLTFSRQDVHEVTVGLSLPVQPTPSTPGKNKPSQLLLTAAGGGAQQAAAQAVEQSITRYQLLSRPILVSP
jgi:hypothetical protein